MIKQHRRRGAVIGNRKSRKSHQGLSKFFPAMAVVTLLATLLTGLPAPAQVVNSFTIRYQTNDTGDIVLVGNTLLTCPTSTSGCTSAQAGTNPNGQNNNFNMVYVDVDSDPTTFDSSTANLNLPAGATVLFAGLYWGGDSSNTARNQASFATPATGGYTNLTATTLYSTTAYQNTYQGFVNVTSLVQAGGNGTYTVANVQSTTGSTNHWAGWSLVIVYRNPGQPPRNLTIFDGLAIVSGSYPTVNIPINGFRTPPNGAVNVKLGAIAYDGDSGVGVATSTYTGDKFQLNGNNLSDAINPANDFFNSTISYLGSQVTSKNPNYINQLGFDADIVNANGFIANNATSATLTLTTGGETYMPGVVTSAIDLYAPVLNINKTVNDINGGNLEIGDILEYTLIVTNNKDANGNGDPAIDSVLKDSIPAYTTYVPSSLQIDGVGKSDTAADDQAEYDSINKAVVYRLGTGATATNGGTLNVSPAAGSSTTISFRVRVNSATPNATRINNQAQMSYNGQTLGAGTTLAASSSSSTITVTPSNQAELSINKSHTGNFTVRQNGSYTLTVTNNGPSPATQPTVTDNLPTGLSFVSGTGTGWTCSASGQTVTCTNSSDLIQGTNSTINLTVAVGAGTAASVTNTASVSSTTPDPNTANNSATDITTVSIPSRLRLVKRITLINSTNINNFVDDPGSDDNASNWPVPTDNSSGISTFLRGAIDGGSVKPKDVVEYTIYFLSDGGSDVTNVALCDLLPANTSFIPTTYNGLTPTDGGLPGVDSGIALAIGSTTPTFYLTNVADTDRGQFFSPGTQAPVACNSPSFTSPVSASSNVSGAVVVNVVTSPTTLPKANAPGNPANSYGFVRFRVRVN